MVPNFLNQNHYPNLYNQKNLKILYLINFKKAIFIKNYYPYKNFIISCIIFYFKIAVNILNFIYIFQIIWCFIIALVSIF